MWSPSRSALLNVVTSDLMSTHGVRASGPLSRGVSRALRSATCITALVAPQVGSSRLGSHLESRQRTVGVCVHGKTHPTGSAKTGDRMCQSRSLGLPCGAPSAQATGRVTHGSRAHRASVAEAAGSALGHWAHSVTSLNKWDQCALTLIWRAGLSPTVRITLLAIDAEFHVHHGPWTGRVSFRFLGFEGGTNQGRNPNRASPQRRRKTQTMERNSAQLRSPCGSCS